MTERTLDMKASPKLESKGGSISLPFPVVVPIAAPGSPVAVVGAVPNHAKAVVPTPGGFVWQDRPPRLLTVVLTGQAYMVSGGPDNIRIAVWKNGAPIPGGSGDFYFDGNGPPQRKAFALTTTVEIEVDDVLQTYVTNLDDASDVGLYELNMTIMG